MTFHKVFSSNDNLWTLELYRLNLQINLSTESADGRLPEIL